MTDKAANEMVDRMSSAQEKARAAAQLQVEHNKAMEQLNDPEKQ